MAGPLAGFRVLDFGQYIAGPMLGMLLGDQGADVVKVERPGGDPYRRHPAFGVYNRGKRSIALDLKTERGHRTVLSLAQEADVLIENFRPGVAARLGLGYEELRQVNPRLVYCSLPGFAAESGLAHVPGWEPLIGAATATYAPNQHSREPVFTQIPLASTYAAMLAATSTAVALFARDRLGLGQHVEVPLHSATFVAMGYRLLRIDGRPDQSPAGRQANPLVSVHRCRDGRYVMLHAALEHFITAFLGVAGKSHWREEGLVDREAWETDPARLTELARRLDELFLERDAQEWEDQISAAGVPCAVCRTVDEWLVHPHALESGMVITVDDPAYGPMKQLGLQARLREALPDLPGPAPRLDEHGAAIRREVELRAGATPNGQPVGAGFKPAPTPKAGALAGIKVLDLCLILAGPTCGRMLAEFGANVIKIDSPKRTVSPSFFLDTSRGKRSMTLDLKSPEGLEVFWKLAEQADVVVENFREGVAERLGIGYEQLRERCPDIIVGSINCYGYRGPWTKRPGWEQIAQAATGIQVRQGGRDGVPTLMPFAVTDYGTGVMGAYPVVLALLARNRTGRGQRTETALSFTGMALQSNLAIDYPGFVRREIEGPQARGVSATSRLYRTEDGRWLYLHCIRPADWASLAGLEEFGALADDPSFATVEGRRDGNAELAAGLAAIFAIRPIAYWVERLQKAKVPAVRSASVGELVNAEGIRAAGLVLNTETPGRGVVDHLGISARLSLTPGSNGRAAPLLGADTEAILKELGYGEQAIARLRTTGVI